MGLFEVAEALIMGESMRDVSMHRVLQTGQHPEITTRDGEVTENEGCLSIPGLAYPVARAERIVVRALDEHGNTLEIEAEDFEARVIQHEVDHLDGVLYIDRIDPELRREAMRILRERALGDFRTPVSKVQSRL